MLNNMQFKTILSLVMQDFDSREYKPIIFWNKTDNNAPFTYRNYVVVR